MERALSGLAEITLKIRMLQSHFGDLGEDCTKSSKVSCG
jgi:hypothetical protein